VAPKGFESPTRIQNPNQGMMSSRYLSKFMTPIEM
jgi:hypothetical protein